MLAVEEALDPFVPEKRVKNRANTEDAIFRAARDLLAEKGFQGFGVNAIARRAVSWYTMASCLVCGAPALRIVE